MAAKTALKRGPKPKAHDLIKVPVTVWVQRKHKDTAQVVCEKAVAKYK
jgi:hypothetical protein